MNNQERIKKLIKLAYLNWITQQWLVRITWISTNTIVAMEKWEQVTPKTEKKFLENFLDFVDTLQANTIKLYHK